MKLNFSIAIGKSGLLAVLLLAPVLATAQMGGPALVRVAPAAMTG